MITESGTLFIYSYNVRHTEPQHLWTEGTIWSLTRLKVVLKTAATLTKVRQAEQLFTSNLNWN